MKRAAEPARPRRRPAAAPGYTLAALVIMVTVISILVAAALPVWSRIVQRQNEEELIFRGLQYAEAIRVFQLRHGRLPVALDELLKVQPRSIRQLWTDPMNEEGKWGLIIARAGPAQGGRRQGENGDSDGRGDAEDGRQQPIQPLASARRGEVVTGPILGVHSRAEGEAIRSFLGGSDYSSWQFTADLIPLPQIVPGAPFVPRATSDWIGRPFREGLSPLTGPAGLVPGGQGAAPLAPGQTVRPANPAGRRGGASERLDDGG